MRTDTILTALVAWAAIATALPRRSAKKGAFSVNTLGNGKVAEMKMDVPSAMRKAYLKHNIQLLPGMEKSKAAASPSAPSVEASEPAVSQMNDDEYLSPVTVGGAQMNMDFDTGSSDFWVFSDLLPQSQLIDHNAYTALEHSGKQMSGYTWSIGYVDGSGASGVVYADKVQIGSATATMQAVEAATSISNEFVMDGSDGLMGLAFRGLNTIQPMQQPTFFENIMEQLEQPVFTVSLKKNATGTYDFGFIDNNKYTDSLAYVPVNSSNGYWQFDIGGYKVGNTTKRALGSIAYPAIADTGTTLMLLPAAMVKDYYSEVPGAQNQSVGWVFPCTTTLPDLTLMMSTGIPGGDPAYAVVQGEFMNRSAVINGSEMCWGGIQTGPDNLSILGDVFLKSQFVVFDMAAPRLGFAPQVGLNVTLPAPKNPSPEERTGASAVVTTTKTSSATRPGSPLAPFVRFATNLMGRRKGPMRPVILPAVR